MPVPVLRIKETIEGSDEANASAAILEIAIVEGSTTIAKKGILAEPLPVGEFDPTIPHSGESGY